MYVGTLHLLRPLEKAQLGICTSIVFVQCGQINARAKLLFFLLNLLLFYVLLAMAVVVAKAPSIKYETL